MAITASGLYCDSFKKALDGTIALDLDLTTHKVAMYTNSLTPDFTNDTGYSAAPYTSNEVSGTGYSAGGATLSGTSLAKASGNLTFDANDASWSSSTISNARGAYIYADALASKNGICLVNFGADYSTSSGTFTIQWSGSGIFVLDLTP